MRSRTAARIAQASSIAKAQATTATATTVLFASSEFDDDPIPTEGRIETNQPDQEIHRLKEFPRWLRLSATAPVENRLDVTNRVVDSISKGGGFLSSSNLLSDLATCLVIEDLQPLKINKFYLALQEIDSADFKLHPDSIDLMEQCSEMVARHRGDTNADEERKRHNATTLPVTVAGVFQIAWKGSTGKLTHDIVSDG